MKRTLVTAALLSAFIAMPAYAQRQDHHGMGGGMMHGQGMGAGMMDGHQADAYSGLKLSSEQRAKLDDIQRDLQQKQREAMSRMHEQAFHMHDPLALASVDEQTARKSFEAMSVAMKEMFEVSLQAGKRMNALLTDEQREQLRNKHSKP